MVGRCGGNGAVICGATVTGGAVIAGAEASIDTAGRPVTVSEDELGRRGGTARSFGFRKVKKMFEGAVEMM